MLASYTHEVWRNGTPHEYLWLNRGKEETKWTTLSKRSQSG